MPAALSSRLAALPRLTLGLCALLALVYLFWHPFDVRRQHDLDDRYQRQLLAVEWPNYDPYLRQHQLSSLANQLDALYDKKDYLSLAHQLGADTDFVASVRASSFLDNDTKTQWGADRGNYDKLHRGLSAYALGLNPQSFRPITFFTYQLVPQFLPGLLANLALLLICGFLLRPLGGRILLAAYFLGGIGGGLVFLVLNSHSVFPLATASVGTASVVGLLLMQLRGETLELAGRPLRHVGWIVTSLWLGKECAEYFVEHLPPGILIPHAAGFGSGVLVWLGHRRWYRRREQAALLAGEEEEDMDEQYRDGLDQALKSIGKMNFGEARQQLQGLVASYPQDLRLWTQLYHLDKLKPDSEDFEHSARQVFTVSNTDEAARAGLLVYRDYSRITSSRHALDTDTSLKLIMRFARVGELKEADKLMRAVLTSHERHELLAKAANTLALGYDKNNDPAQAKFYREIVGKASA